MVHVIENARTIILKERAYIIKDWETLGRLDQEKLIECILHMREHGDPHKAGAFLVKARFEHRDEPSEFHYNSTINVDIWDAERDGRFIDWNPDHSSSHYFVDGMMEFCGNCGVHEGFDWDSE